MSERAAAEESNRKLVAAARQAADATGLPIVPDAKTSEPLYISSRDLPLKFLIPVAKIKPFFDAMKEGRLTATVCVKCGAKYFPPQADCPACRTSRVKYVGLSRDAVLMAFTVINVKPFSFMQYDDYVVAIGRLSEGLNVLAWMKDVEPRKIRVGMKLRLKVEKREMDGIYTYWFEPAQPTSP
jgi:hypothetical protein